MDNDNNISQEDIDETIKDIAESHSDYTMEQFVADFRVIMKRDPTFSENRKFQKAVKDAKPVKDVKDAKPVKDVKDAKPVKGQSTAVKPVKEKMGKKLYVANIPYNSTKAQIKAFFETIGLVEEVEFMKAGEYFVTYRNTDSAGEALAKLQGQNLGGRAVHLEMAHHQGPSKPVEQGKKLFVGNVSFKSTEAELRALFEQIGPVESVDELKKGHYFVTYQSAANASEALTKLQNYSLGGRPINIKVARPDPQPHPPPDPQPGPRPDPQPNPRQDPQPNPRRDPQPNPRRDQPDPRPEPRQDPQPDPRRNPQPDPRRDPQPDPPVQLGKATQIQVIDPNGKLNEKLVEAVSAAWGTRPWKKIQLVSIVGAQSSGKSSLLNCLFKTDFPVLDVAKEGYQKQTKGLWISNSRVNAVDTPDQIMVMDVEGVDGIETANNLTAKTFENRLTMFCLCLSSVVIVNLWETALGLVEGACLPMLESVFRGLRQIKTSKEDTRTVLLFVIRDYNNEVPVDLHYETVDRMVHQAWLTASAAEDEGGPNKTALPPPKPQSSSSTASTASSPTSSPPKASSKSPAPKTSSPPPQAAKASTSPPPVLLAFEDVFELLVYALPSIVPTATAAAPAAAPPPCSAAAAAAARANTSGSENKLVTDLRAAFHDRTHQMYLFPPRSTRVFPGVQELAKLAGMVWGFAGQNRTVEMRSLRELVALDGCLAKRIELFDMVNPRVQKLATELHEVEAASKEGKETAGSSERVKGLLDRASEIVSDAERMFRNEAPENVEAVHQRVAGCIRRDLRDWSDSFMNSCLMNMDKQTVSKLKEEHAEKLAKAEQDVRNRTNEILRLQAEAREIIRQNASLALELEEQKELTKQAEARLKSVILIGDKIAQGHVEELKMTQAECNRQLGITVEKEKTLQAEQDKLRRLEDLISQRERELQQAELDLQEAQRRLDRAHQAKADRLERERRAAIEAEMRRRQDALGRGED